MNIKDEIEQAAEELAFEFSQSQWEDALIYGFRKDLSMGGVMAYASGLKSEINSEDWEKLTERAGLMKPSFCKWSSCKNNCRIWMASHAKYAADAMWDGDYERAKRLIKRGGVREKLITQAKRECKKETKIETGGLLIVDVRNRDRRANWKTVK